MIGYLPVKLNINGIDRAIRSDYRVALTIMLAYSDADLTDDEKTYILLDCLYENLEDFKQEDLQESVEKAILFLDGKLEASVDEPQPTKPKKIIDWEQDEQIIFSAINKVAGMETRSLNYLHWWTFLGYFNEIGEGLFSTVINIRQKKNSGKKLDKFEQEYYNEHKSMIDLKTRYTQEEQAEIDYLNKLLG